MLYIWTLPVLSLTQRSVNDIAVLLSSRSLAWYLNTPAWKIPNLGQIKNIYIFDISTFFMKDYPKIVKNKTGLWNNAFVDL